MTDTIREQILSLRKLPNCPNMFSIQEVFELALAQGYDELCDFIFTDTRGYCSFILCGDPQD